LSRAQAGCIRRAPGEGRGAELLATFTEWKPRASAVARGVSTVVDNAAAYVVEKQIRPYAT
jgi:hypothetical protein